MTAPPAAPNGPKTTAPTPAPMPAPSSLPASAVRGTADKNTTIIPVLNAECMTDLSFEWVVRWNNAPQSNLLPREVDCFDATVKAVGINHAQAKRRCRLRSGLQNGRRHLRTDLSEGGATCACNFHPSVGLLEGLADVERARVTADLDRAPARVRRVKRVGRDEGTGSAADTNKGTGRNKKGSHHMI